ncbi:hypothetical protein ACTNDG_12440 [Clostridium sp. HCP1S3_B4]|uniref:hypothetical protein n=1 Tax=unclassified Clostridium TaxID=2614128 RepID=UPI003F8A598A
MKYIFVDFEMNPIDKKHCNICNKCSREIIEIGAVMLDEDFNKVSSYKSFVKP